MSFVYIDFETTSEADIKKLGAFAYVHHPSTQPTLLAWHKDGESGLVDFTEGESVPPGLIDPHKDTVVAWNAEFDRLVWNRFCSPRIPLRNWLDAAVLAAALGFPRQLDAATGQKVKLTAQCKRWCMTTPIRELAQQSEKRERYWQDFRYYCQQDVEAMRSFVEPWLPLPTWLGTVVRVDAMLDAELNIRGIPVDRPAIERARQRIQKLLPNMLGEFASLTGGLKPTQVQKFREWLAVRLPNHPVPDLREQTVNALLDDPTLPAPVRRALVIRQHTSKASLKKLDTLLAASEHDGRVHGGIVTYGAGTGRAAGRLVQPHNLPRPSIEQPEIDRHFEEGFVNADTQALSDCLRGFIRAPKGPLSAVDYSNIEGRVLAWLAGETWKVEAFRAFDRGDGEDIYLLTAKRAGVPGERQIGKTIELACGYQGSVGAFQTMAALTGVQVPDDRALALVRAWRAAHPNVVDLWAKMEHMALLAAKSEGGRFRVNDRLVFIREPGWLWLELPSGRRIAYRSPRVGVLENDYGVKQTVFYRNTTRHTPTPTYGGKLTENAVQAVARDLLYAALLRARKAGLRVIMHVHDEIVVEGGKRERALLAKAMRVAPDWAEGLPINVEGWTHERYRK